MEIEKSKAKVKVLEQELQGLPEHDVDVDLAEIPTLEKGAYAKEFVDGLPDIPVPDYQINSPDISLPANFSANKSMNKLSESVSKTLNILDELALSNKSSYAPAFNVNNTTPIYTQTSASIPRVLTLSQPQVRLPLRSTSFEVTDQYPVISNHHKPLSSEWLRTNSLHKKSSEGDSVGMSSLFRRLQAPTVQLEVFSGNAIDFPFFITNFSQAVEENITDEKGKLLRLIQYTDGAAKELVKSCIYLPEETCYKRAKQLLIQKYGNPFVINAEYRKRLSTWPRLKPNDAVSFSSFENFLIKFQSSMHAVGRTTDCSPELLQILQTKLPPYLQDRWSRKVFQIRKDFKKEASLDDFIQRITEETEIISDPLFSRDAINELSKGRDYTNQKPRSKVFGISSEEICMCCSKRWHDLEKCFKYRDMEQREKRKFIFQHRLCFRCLKPISDTHIGKSCKNPRTCQVCKEPHPTSLHEVEEAKPLKSAFASQSNSVGLGCVSQY